jgi:predicted ATPase
MKIERLSVDNYKSCKSVEISPRNLSIIIGRNAAGKSNFVDALDFLGSVYRVGLENAVAIKGGYENIAFRRARRARSEIGFHVCAKYFAKNLRIASAVGLRYASATRRQGDLMLKFEHSFAFRAKGREIGAKDRFVEKVSIFRDGDGLVTFEGNQESELARNLSYYIEFNRVEKRADRSRVSPTELMVSMPFYSGRLISQFVRFFRGISVFQLSPELSRQPGVPSPNPTLGRGGSNLPAVVNWLKRRHPRVWNQVQAAMADITPEIERIDVDYLHTRTLGLNFYEAGVGRPWTAEQVSDGTVRALAMLVSCFDPRVSLLIMEEPENSVHPWVVQNVVRNLKEISAERDVFVTTHSPSVINSVSPEDVWVAYKHNGATSLVHLPVLDTSVVEGWKEGAYRLFEYIESGALPQAVPGGRA